MRNVKKAMGSVVMALAVSTSMFASTASAETADDALSSTSVEMPGSIESVEPNLPPVVEVETTDTTQVATSNVRIYNEGRYTVLQVKKEVNGYRYANAKKAYAYDKVVRLPVGSVVQDSGKVKTKKATYYRVKSFDGTSVYINKAGVARTYNDYGKYKAVSAKNKKTVYTGKEPVVLYTDLNMYISSDFEALAPNAKMKIKGTQKLNGVTYAHVKTTTGLEGFVKLSDLRKVK